MSIHEVTYYQAKCDGCGYIEDDYGDFSAMAHAESVFELLDDWATYQRDLCPDCQKCEVCGERGYETGDHIVCDEHEDHNFDAAEASE